jgi:DNA repair exonuclease SbcCD ATPase subunit
MKFLEGKMVNHVYHLADLHIRNLKRHKEYRKVLNQFLKNVKKDKLKDAIIYLGGDIAHAKTEMSPELVREISWFLNECAKLHPTFVITGNHDCNMNNPSRLDVLTPIVENLNNSNVHYLRDTDVHQIGNLTVGVFSIFSNKDEWPKGMDIVGENKICFFHGPVDKSTTDVGYNVSSKNFTVDMFDGYDIAMLGDIHKRQIVQEYNPKLKKPIVVYASSIIQQNHGELMQGHGYLLWDIPKRTFKEFDIHNDYGYMTIDVVSGIIPKWVYDELDTLPKYPKIRARFSDTEPSDVKLVLVKLKELFSATEITVTRSDTLSKLKGNHLLNGNVVGNVKDVDFQNKLIRDYLDRHFILSDVEIDKIIEINNTVNNSITDRDVSGTVLWIPKTFEFSNMFSYGENNKIDFTKANGIVGIFAPNASGKSSALDSLSFCIFDKSSRAFKAKHILNNKKSEFYCKFEFEIDGISYFIERLAVLNKKTDSVKVDVNFWREKDGVPESLNGEQRRDTNLIIEQYLGTYEDFVLTTLSLQGNNALFIDKTQSERKDILSQFIGVNVFDKLYNVASELNKETSTLIRKFKQDDFSEKLIELNASFKSTQNEYELITLELNSLKSEQLKLNNSILDKTSELIRIDADVYDIVELNSNKSLITSKIEELDTLMNSTKEELGKLIDLQSNLSDLLNSNEYISIDNRRDEFMKFTNMLKDVNHKIEKSELQLNSFKASLNHLNEHEYNSECDICIKNSENIIKSKETINSDIDRVTEDLLELGIQYGHIETKLTEYGDVTSIWDEYVDILSKKSKVDSKITEYKHKGSTLLNNRLKSVNELDKINDSIKKYYENENAYKLNKVIQSEISKLKNELLVIQRDIKSNEDRTLIINSKKTTIDNNIQSLTQRINEVKELEEQYKLYEYYLDAVKRDGISYELISRVIPIIEGEINNILGQMVEFGVQMEMDGKNINASIVYNDQQWPLEMSSGMERFISGLAIRVALINICNLPRPNFLVVDEGFGSLDSENMTSMFMMFNYLKTQFDFIMIISHIDSMRDVVDQLMEIKKVNGHSYLRF